MGTDDGKMNFRSRHKDRARAEPTCRATSRTRGPDGYPPRMSCPHLEATAAGLETAFTVDASRVTFGAGALAEVGDRARALGIRRAAVFTDPRLRKLPLFAELSHSLTAAGIDAAVFDSVS